MPTTQSRRPSGTPVGGQFAATSRPRPAFELGAEPDSSSSDNERPCSTCGTPTKRSSGLCRRCDPARAAKRSAGGVGNCASPLRAKLDAQMLLDRSAEPVRPEDIRACAFSFVPMYRNGAATGEFRRCANAVVAPATVCHRHGGDTSTSLGRSVPKATAEAERGECYPLAAEHWESSKARLEAAEGMLSEMMSTDTSRMAQMMVALRRQHAKTSVGRMSPGNQMLILSQHWRGARSDGYDSDEALEEALRRSGEPHMTAAAWARAGRTPLPGAEPVAAVWAAPGREPKRRDGESDEEYAERAASARRTRFGGVLEYRLSQTEGEPFDEPADPIGEFRPSGYGDPEAAISTMTGLASDMGVTVEMTDQRPAGGAYAYWRADQSRIVVWNGIADGDRRAIAHSLAHELGHARLGHSTQAQTDTSRADKETSAECFAALVCAHHGIDTSELSAHYVADWRRSEGIEMTSASNSAFRHAVEAYDDYAVATGWERDDS